MYQISYFQLSMADKLMYDIKLYDKSILGMYTLLFLRADKMAFHSFYFKVIVQIAH